VLALPGIHQVRRYSIRDQLYRPVESASATGTAPFQSIEGLSPRTRRLLIVREAQEHGRIRRRFEELRLDDLALVRQASNPELLPDGGRTSPGGATRSRCAEGESR
jgi:hypothetical protein